MTVINGQKWPKNGFGAKNWTDQDDKRWETDIIFFCSKNKILIQNNYFYEAYFS